MSSNSDITCHLPVEIRDIVTMRPLIVLNSGRMFLSTAIVCTLLPQVLPAPFLPTLSQLQQLPLQFQRGLHYLLCHGPVLIHKGRPTTLPPWSHTKKPRPSSQQHQQDQLLQFQPEEVGGGEREPEKAKPWGGIPGGTHPGISPLSGQLVSVMTSTIHEDTEETSLGNNNDADALFREDVLLGPPLHDKKINQFRNRV